MHLSDEVVYFYHIPKTAGTSVTEWLRRNYPEDKYCPYGTLEEIDLLSPLQLRQYRLFAGHMGWELLRRLDSRPVIISFFRDPVERVCSSYWYFRHLSAATRATLLTPSAQLQAEAATRLSLEEWIELPEEPYSIHNHMTWLMAGAEASTLPPFTTAIAKLMTIDVIGLTHEMNNSLALICDRLGLPPSLEIPRQNESDRKASLPSPELQEQIRRLNWMDQSLYQTAVGLFQERYAALTRKLGIAVPVPALGHSNGQIPAADPLDQFFAQDWHFLQQPPPGPRLYSGFVPAGSEYFHTGWFPPAPSIHHPAETLRWNSHQLASRLLLPLATERDMQIEFLLSEIADIRLLGHIGVTANNQPLDLAILSRPSTKFPYAHVLKCVIPVDVLRLSGGLTKIHLINHQPNSYPRGIRPVVFRHLLSSENLPLGCGFSGIRLTQL